MWRGPCFTASAVNCASNTSEGREDQLGALGLVLNMIVLWNTLCMQAALNQLRANGEPVNDADVAQAFAAAS